MPHGIVLDGQSGSISATKGLFPQDPKNTHHIHTARKLKAAGGEAPTTLGVLLRVGHALIVKDPWKTTRGDVIPRQRPFSCDAQYTIFALDETQQLDDWRRARTQSGS